MAAWGQFLADNDGSAPPHVVWDAFKLYVKSTLVTRINSLKRASAADLEKVIEDLTRAEQECLHNPSPERAATLKLHSRAVTQMQYEKSKRKLFFCKQNLFEHGEKAGKLLLHREDRPAVVISLSSDDGTMVLEPRRVTEIFRNFYTNLYTSTVGNAHSDVESFLGEIQLPHLTVQQMTDLDRSLSTEEIAEAIAAFPRSKSPGSDGLRLHKLYNHIFETSTLPASMREATIVLIAKPGKDPHHPEAYRPISLLQVDVKILAKILATCLNTVILSLIHEDQAGFMPGRNTSFNLRRLFINLQTQHDNTGTRMIVALDTVKAFDSVEWTYLWTCLKRFGIGPRFRKWVQLLYQSPVVRVVANGWASDQFPLTRGTHQGCPLSHLLYALAAEPLSVSLRSNPDIAGLRIGPITETVSTYADDTLLYIDGSTDALQKALATIERFGSFSGLKINWNKSQILPLDSFPETRVQAQLPLQS